VLQLNTAKNAGVGGLDARVLASGSYTVFK